jgi:hypothetical protein
MSNNKMATLIAAGAVATALGLGSLGLADPALATVPSGPGTARDTVNLLQAQGYTVIVNKVGAAPLDQCTPTGLRPGHTYSRTDSGAPGAGKTITTTVTGKTVYLTVTCE